MTARIESLGAFPWNIELTTPFSIATGAQALAANVYVKLRLINGTVGLGEAAPFPAVNGETQEATLVALGTLMPLAIERPITEWRTIAQEAAELCGPAKSALCAFESALLDAFCKHTRTSLWAWAGGSERCLYTDITIPTGSPEAARQAAHQATLQGFTTLKIKVGAIHESPLQNDLERIRATLQVAPTADLILDGNAALSIDDAVEMIRQLGPLRAQVRVFEQPTARDDLDGLRAVQERTQIPVAADESAGSVRDVERIAREQAAAIINVKIMKSGVLEAQRMITAAKRLGLGLMVGGMVESDLAMGVSACLAAGMGGFDWVDLDTPLFMKHAPTRGGVLRSGNRIEIDPSCIGHGVRLV
ncbi:MAG TPA: dipeptide epimerase [Polyangiaceae bacterium]|nr:dipeptide epimerase [Polyangiaceae bacterium]